MNHRFILLFFIIILFSCGGTSSSNEEKAINIDPHHSAIPDSDSGIESELSEADKKKLAEANGMEAEIISMPVLNVHLQNLKSTTALCYFWSVTTGNSQEAFKHLKKISSQIASEKLEIIIVHMEAGDYVEEVNAVVREHGIDAEVFMLNEPTSILENLIGTEDKWDAQLPAFYIYNKDDGTGLRIGGTMDYAELFVMIQPFMM